MWSAKYLGWNKNWSDNAKVISGLVVREGSQFEVKVGVPGSIWLDSTRTLALTDHQYASNVPLAQLLRHFHQTITVNLKNLIRFVIFSLFTSAQIC